MAEQSLRNKTKKGLAWSVIERLATQGVQFLFGIVLARILSPDDYGVIAMPLVFLSIAQCFIDSGFSGALIRKQDLKEEDLSTAFYFNIVVGIFCYSLLFVLSPLIAEFYNTPILSKLLKVTALATLFNPLCTVQQAILTKKIDFRTQAIISLTGAVISGVVGLAMAYSGYGVWSLVFQQVAGYAIRTIMLWLFSNWRPKWIWSWDSFHYLWGFGSKLMGVGIIDTIYTNIYPIVIGKFYNAGDLGNYTRAQQFANLPSSNITGIIQRVTYPVMCAVQDEYEKLKSSYRKILKLSAFLIFPLMTGLSAVADPLIRILLTDKWEDCILLLQIMCFSMMWYPIHAINLNLLEVKGRSDLFLQLEIIKKIMITIVMIITIPNGIIWMVGGSVLTSVLCLFINTYYTGKIIDMGFVQQMKDLLPILVVSCLMCVLVHLLFLFVGNDILRLVLGCGFGVTFYFIASKMFLKEEYDEALSMLPASIRERFKL